MRRPGAPRLRSPAVRDIVRRMENGPLHRGDWVEVRGPAEILATLDDRGTMSGLKFMAEMASYCGRRLRVASRAEKICDTIKYTGSRRLPDAVFLEDNRCDGSAHGGCQAECRLLWKEAWLRRVAPDAPAGAPPAQADLDALIERARRDTNYTLEVDGRSRQRWRCQATSLLDASERLGTFDPVPYVREYACGNVSLSRFLRVSARAVVAETARKMGLIAEVPLPGTAGPDTVEETLDLKPGELVQIRSAQEIAATLDAGGRSRGMWFDREMMVYCGRTARVRRRVERFIDDRDGRLVEMKSPVVSLDGVVCSGDHSLRRWFCAREIFPYWRECWLRRVP